MSAVKYVADLVIRQALSTTAAPTIAAAAATSAPACSTNNNYDGRLGLRISAIFVILIGSTFGESVYSQGRFIILTAIPGACFPVFAERHRGVGVPEWAFFVAKYFGSGVIIATAFIHVCVPLQ